jgi:hypothetical protein
MKPQQPWGDGIALHWSVSKHQHVTGMWHTTFFGQTKASP